MRQYTRYYVRTSRFLFLLGLSFGSIASFRSRRDWRLGSTSVFSRLTLFAGCIGFALTSAFTFSTVFLETKLASWRFSSSSKARFRAIFASRSNSLSRRQLLFEKYLIISTNYSVGLGMSAVRFWYTQWVQSSRQKTVASQSTT